MLQEPTLGKPEAADGSRVASLVVPTFREAENLPALAGRRGVALSGRGIEGELARRLAVVPESAPEVVPGSVVARV